MTISILEQRIFFQFIVRTWVGFLRLRHLQSASVMKSARGSSQYRTTSLWRLIWRYTSNQIAVLLKVLTHKGNKIRFLCLVLVWNAWKGFHLVWSRRGHQFEFKVSPSTQNHSSISPTIELIKDITQALISCALFLHTNSTLFFSLKGAWSRHQFSSYISCARELILTATSYPTRTQIWACRF